MMGLTRQQAQALDAIKRLTVGEVSPSYAEIRAELGLASNAGVVRLLEALRERGFIEFQYQRARSIRILGELEGLERRSTADLQALARRINAILRGRAS